ncbi:hypothetical protein UFOVP323_37 [uncultured Caudovirales phage]|uniref:Uncharacterized protein n=1 Tax=uncultured Caudovirales phage TaxID=2100421 RepID=A0A6J5LT53_9CAUD|nr:hypothetical protein UFOVP323_37 [uncultured Caudovirales phage]
MRVSQHLTEIEGTEQLEIFKLENGTISIKMGSHPLECREEITIVLSKEGVEELINDLQKIIQ